MRGADEAHASRLRASSELSQVGAPPPSASGKPAGSAHVHAVGSGATPSAQRMLRHMSVRAMAAPLGPGHEQPRLPCTATPPLPQMMSPQIDGDRDRDAPKHAPKLRFSTSNSGGRGNVTRSRPREISRGCRPSAALIASTRPAVQASRSESSLPNEVHASLQAMVSKHDSKEPWWDPTAPLVPSLRGHDEMASRRVRPGRPKSGPGLDEQDHATVPPCGSDSGAAPSAPWTTRRQTACSTRRARWA